MVHRSWRPFATVAMILAASLTVAGAAAGQGASSGDVTVTGSSVAVMQLVVEPVTRPEITSHPSILGAVRVRANVAWHVTALASDPGAPVLFELVAGAGGPAAIVAGGPTASTVLLIRSDRPDGLAGVALRIVGADGA